MESAWGEADMDMGDSDKSAVLHLRSSSTEEDSRYSNQHTRKRRRFGITNESNKPPDFFVSDSEEGELFSQSNRHPSDGGSTQPRQKDTRNDRLEAKRAYWASKGMSGGGLQDSD